MSRVRANTIMDQAGSGGPDFPYGFTASTGTVTGILTAATYDISDLNVSAAATVSSSSVSTSSTTGALVVTGGVCIVKSLFVVGNISCAGTITYEDVTNIDSVGIVTANTGLHVKAGGVTIVGVTTGLSVSGVGTFGAITATTITGSSVLTVSDTTQSTTKDTGAIILNGGIGCEKNLNVGTACSIEGAGIATFSGGMKVGGGNGLREKAHIQTNPWSNSLSSGDLNLDYGNIFLCTGNLAGAASTLNITSSVGINTLMVTGDCLTVTGITSVNSTSSYINTLHIDHNAVQVAWVNGSAPTAGGGSGYDTYMFNIIKTANLAYAVVGNHVKTS